MKVVYYIISRDFLSSLNLIKSYISLKLLTDSYGNRSDRSFEADQKIFQGVVIHPALGSFVLM